MEYYGTLALMLWVTGVNVFILALNLKLYTEFAKQRMQEVRKQP